MTTALPAENRYFRLLGATPLAPIRLPGQASTIWCKLEFLQPSGSTKDRIATHILEKAWRQGRIGPGSTVIEASSGSTSIAMALACAQLGLKFIAVMPAGVSNERSMMIRGYGGEVRFSPQADGILGAVREAEKEAERLGAFLPRQFDNPDNAEAHRVGTAREIVAQIPTGKVDAAVSGVGTGGTLVGLFEGFRDHGCGCVPVLAIPVGGKITPEVECCSFSSRIPGVVHGISTIFRREALPGLVEMEIDADEALTTTRELIAHGYPVGPSSGLNYLAAVRMAQRLPEGSQIVTVFPDRMERYFSTELFASLR